jgi:hypothetical protein
MLNSRHHRLAAIACALVCALVAPVAANAEMRTSSLAGTTSTPSQDLRPPDTRDHAMGRDTSAAPDVTVVKFPQRGPVITHVGVSWPGVGIGAGSVLIVLGLAGATAIGFRKRRGPQPAIAV